jgi:gliding motility-associated-like protein
MTSSSALNIIAANSNSGGPFSISWIDSGRHVIQLNTSTEQGCKSEPSFDTIDVHTIPDASFKVTLRPGSLCIEDSVLFTANATNYNYSYLWSPAHFFNSVNKPSIWGRVEQSKSIITLTVTDPFGCIAGNSVEIDPGSCCTVSFPNAFSPDGDGQNDFFRPIYAGYHRFHIFRVANRWGQTVYESSNNKMQWDGNYNGVPQDVGVYYYYIKFDCGGNTLEQTGDVTLIR